MLAYQSIEELTPNRQMAQSLQSPSQVTAVTHEFQVAASQSASSLQYVEGVDFVRPSQMFARMAGQPITGATIITHGFQIGDRDGDSLLPLGERIWFKVDALNGGVESSYLLDYDVGGQNAGGVFDLSQSRLPATGRLQPGRLTLIFD